MMRPATAGARPSESAAHEPLSYAQWIRHAVTSTRNAYVLFDSSVDEPRDLLREKLADAFANGLSDRYTSAFVKGNPFVVAALARRYQVTPDMILCTSAATTSLGIVYKAYLAPGDHILVETPRFDLLETTATSMGAEATPFRRAEADGRLDLDAIARAITPKTRLIVLSDLHNPSGMLLPDDDLKALAHLAERHGVLVVVDEVYGDYAEGNRRPSAVHVSPNIIAINSLTKIYGLSTLRCGWIFAHPDVMTALRDIAGRFDFTISNVAHAVAALVLEDDATFDAYRRQVMTETRPIMTEAFARLQADGLIEGVMPEYGCILFPKLIGIDDTRAFSDWLAEHHDVRVAPGEYFGQAGHVRIGFAKPVAGLRAAFERLREGLLAYTGR